MTKFISKMNRIDWVGNPGPVIRRGEEFEMDESDCTEQWLSAGNITAHEAAVTPDSKPASKPKQSQNGKKEKTGPIGV